jgi:hypothetical protein
MSGFPSLPPGHDRPESIEFDQKFNDGRNRLMSDENSRLPGRVNFISNEGMQYPAGSLQNVSYDGWLGMFNIGA